MDLQDPALGKGIPKQYLGEDLESTPKTAKAVPSEPESRIGDPENPIEDFWDQAKGLVTGVANLGQGYWNLASDSKYRDEWKKGWSDLMSGKYHRDVGNHLWKGLKEETSSHWTNPEGNFDLGYTLWHHPASALMDLSVVKDVAGGGAKLFGKMSGGVSRAMATAKELSEMGPMTTADKLVHYGEKAMNWHIDPFQLAGKAIGKTAVGEWLKTELGFGPETKNLDRIAGDVNAEVQAEAALKARLLLDAKLGEGSGDRIFNALDRGAAEDFTALQPAEQDFINRYRATQGIESPEYGEIAKGLPQRERLMKQRGMIPEDSSEVLAKQAALRNWGEGSVTEERIAEALQKIKSGEWKPTYRHLGHEADHEYSMLEKFLQDVRGENRATGVSGVPQLNQRTGMGQSYQKDVMVNQVKQVLMEGQFDKKIRLMDRVLDYLQKKGLVKWAKGDEVPRGFSVVPSEVWNRYMIQERRAHGLAWAEKLSGSDPIKMQRDAYAKLVLDPKLMDEFKGKGILVPTHVANWLKFRLAIPSPIGRKYDNMMRYWKSMATVLRPQYWINVAAGNGFLSALHGVSPMDAARYWRNRKYLPPELRAIPQTSADILNATRYQKAITDLRTFDGMVHTHLTKGPGFAHEVEGIRLQAKETAKALHNAGQKFFIGADILDDPDKFYQLVAQSPEKLSKAIQEHVALREQLAGQSGSIIAKQAELDKLNGKSVRLSSRAGRLQRAKPGRVVGEFNAGPPAMEAPLDPYAVGGTRGPALGPGEPMIPSERPQDVYPSGQPGPALGPGQPMIPPDKPHQIYPDQGRFKKGKQERGPFKAGEQPPERPMDPYGDVGGKPGPDLGAARGEFEAGPPSAERPRDVYTSGAHGPKLGPSEPMIPGERPHEVYPDLGGRAPSPQAHEVLGELSTAQRRIMELEGELSGMKEDYINNAMREGHIRGSMPELQRIADWAEKAIGPINDLEGAFNRLHPLEKTWLARAVPFYPWTKAMTKLVFMLPFLHTKQTFLWNRFSSMMQTLTSQEEHMPEYLQGAIHVGIFADGTHMYVKPFWNPFAGERPGTLGGVTMPSMLADIMKQHPLLKVMHDISGGVDTFTMRPWGTDETMTRTDTGEVYKMDQKTGQFVRTIAQPSLWRRLYALIPQSQMVDLFFLPHVQTDKGWLFNPDPVRDSAGDPMYPIPAYQKWSKLLGAPVTYQSEDQRDMAERKQVKLYQGYIKQIRRMPPDQQEAAMQVLEDGMRAQR